MYIEKFEPIEIARRQIMFLGKVHPGLAPEILGNWFRPPSIYKGRQDLLPYRYRFYPGNRPKRARDIFEFLVGSVWFRKPIEDCDVSPNEKFTDYIDYVESVSYIRDPALFTVLRDILAVGTRHAIPVLVHGDATFENFVQHDDLSICAIDPGHPRGFCHVQNDIGKLLQSGLTNWEALKTRSRPAKFEESMLSVDFVNVVSIVSLLCHWLRLLKHAERHEEYVLRHGREVVVPVLTTAINSWVKEHGVSGDACRRGWSPDRLKVLYDLSLPRSV